MRVIRVAFRPKASDRGQSNILYNLESFQNSSDFGPLLPPTKEDKPSTGLWHVSHRCRTTATRQRNGKDTAPCGRLTLLCLHLNADISPWHLPRLHSHVALIWRPNPSYSPGQPGISCAGPSYVHLCSGLAAAGAPSTCLHGSTGSRSTHSHSLPAQSRRSHNMPSRLACSWVRVSPALAIPQRADFRISSLSRPSPWTPLPWLWPTL